MTLTRGKKLVIAATSLVLLAGACSWAGDDGRDVSLAETKAAAMSGDAAAAGRVTAGGAAAPEQASPLPASVTAPRIVKNATLHVEVKDGKFGPSFSEVARIAASAGGFVASSTSAASDDELASGSLTVRIPAEHFEDVRQRIRGLGALKSEDLRGDDVGGQLTDLEARLRNLRSQEEAIRALMAKSNNVQETLQIQNQLSAVREQIEQLDGQRARLDDAVTFATITVQLTEPGVAPAGEQSRLAEAIDRALSGAEAMLAGTIIAIGYLFPVGLLALVAYAALRWMARSRRMAVPATVASGEHSA